MQEQITNPSVSSSIQAASLSESPLEKNVKDVVTLPTRGQGDCAFHALLGEWDIGSHEIVCRDVVTKRQILKEAIVSAKKDENIMHWVVEGIQTWCMEVQVGGLAMQALRQIYQNFLAENEKIAKHLRQQFEEALQQHADILEHLGKYGKINQPLYNKFHDIWNGDKEATAELRRLVGGQPALQQAWENYQHESKKPFDWAENLTPATLEEYAALMGTPRAWMLPSELAIMARVFRRTVIYYPNLGAEPQEFNPGQAQPIIIQFNGSNHFERMVSTAEKNRLLPSPSIHTSPTPTTKTSDTTATSIPISAGSSTTTESRSNPSLSVTTASHSGRSVRYPYLQNALKVAYREKDSLPMPLVGGSFPIQSVSLTINIKEKQQERDQELTQNEEQSKRTDKNNKNYNLGSIKRPAARPKEFGQHQLEREAAWHKVEKPISVTDMFKRIASEENKEKNVQPKQVRRVLVEGRAGVGKTTLVQFIAWQWATQGLFSEQYSYVLWVPLRQWLSGNSQTTEKIRFTEDLAAFVFEQYLSQETTTENLDELEAILDEHSNRTLLILDGYDEVAHYLDEVDSTGQPTLHGQLLVQALKFKNLLITTRDYQLPPASILFDQTLVNIGFTDAQIEQYLTQYQAWLKGASNLQLLSAQPSRHSSASADLTLRKALRDNAQLWALAHIPLNLALLCQTYGNLTPGKTKTAALDEISLTQLYQKVLENFLVRQGKKEGRNLPKFYDLNTLKEKFVVEWNVLSILAWTGFEQGQIVLSPDMQAEVFRDLKLHTYSQLSNFEAYFSHALDLGLMRSQNPNDPTGRDQPRYFIHLTFQEYFAAQYLADSLQGYRGEEAYQKALDWIKQNKYDPHAAVVLGFIAGITAEKGYYDQALSTFWHVLLSPPYEIIPFDLRHLHLILRCLAEANYDERIPERKQLMNEIEQWAKQLVRHSAWNWSYKIRDVFCSAPSKILQSVVLPTLLQASKDQDEDVRRTVTQVLGNLDKKLANFPDIITVLLSLLKDHAKNVRQEAAEVLGNLGEKLTSYPDVIAALFQALKDQDESVRQAATRILGEMSAALANCPDTVQTLVQALKDQDEGVRRTVTQVLGNLDKKLGNFPDVITALLPLLKDHDKNVQREAAKVLGNLGEKLASYPDVIAALLQALEEQNENIQSIVVHALCKMKEALGCFPKVVSILLQLQVLEDKDDCIRKHITLALNNIGVTLDKYPQIKELLLQVLEKQDSEVSEAAAKVLGQMGKRLATQPQVVEALLQALKSRVWFVRAAVVETLGQMGEKLADQSQSKVVKALIQTLKDQDEYVRGAAADALGQMKEQLASQHQLVAALLQQMKDSDWYVRAAVSQALGQMGETLATQTQVVEALRQALKDRNKNVQQAAMRALGQMGKNLVSFPEVIADLFQGLKDKNEHVRRNAAEALNQIGTLTSFPKFLQVVLQALKDQDKDVRRYATAILDQMGEKLASYPDIIAALLQALKDQDEGVRSEAIKVLGKLGEELASYPDIIAALLQALKDQDEGVRQAATRVLDKMNATLVNYPYAVQALVQALEDQDNNVRSEAIKVLGKLGEELASYPYVITAFLPLLKNGNDNVRRETIKALGKLGEKLANYSDVVAALLSLSGIPGDENYVVWTLGRIGEKLACHPNVIHALAQTLTHALLEGEKRNSKSDLYLDRYWDPGFRVSDIITSIIQVLEKVGEKLTDHPQGLLAYLQSFGLTDATHNYGLILLSSAVQYYLKEQSVLIKETWLKATVENLSLVSMAIDSQQLTLYLGNQKQVISFSSLEQIEPLLDALVQRYMISDLPLPNYDAYMSKVALYPEAAKQPLFKTAQFSSPQPLLPHFAQTGQAYLLPTILMTGSAFTDVHINAKGNTNINASQHITFSTVDEKHSRSQQLRQRLKTVPSMTRVFISYAWERWGSQQLEFLQNRFLHNTLVTDLRIAGLSPWLDVREMVGDMDKQMQDNIAQSQFVIMIGTQLYAERSKLPECQLLRLSSFNVGDDLQALPLTTNTAYIRAGNQLFYVSDKTKNQVVWLKHLTSQALQDFDNVTQLDAVSTGKLKKLSKDDLSQITLATCHSHTNVRKEVEFILDRARRPETPKDFLLPLLLEGQFNSTFGEMNEVNQKFLLHDCSNWFSIAESRWNCYKDYIRMLTQTSPFGILPTLLGLNRLPYKIRNNYEQRVKQLKLELEDLDRNQLITATSELERRLQANLLAERQQKLLHNFLREVAAWTNSFDQDIVNSPMVSDNYLLSAVSNTSSNATIHTTPVLSSSTPALPTTPAAQTSTRNAPSSEPPRNPVAPPSSGSAINRYVFFPSQKPTTIQEIQGAAEKQAIMQEKLQELIEDSGYTFSLERVASLGKNDRRLGASADHALVIKFTARDDVSGSEEKIRKKLEAFNDVFQEAIENSGIAFKEKWFKPEWKNWALTIYADTNEKIDCIASLLQIVGNDYIRQEQDQSITCALQ